MGTHADALPYFLFSTHLGLKRHSIMSQRIATKYFHGQKAEKLRRI